MKLKRFIDEARRRSPWKEGHQDIEAAALKSVQGGAERSISVTARVFIALTSPGQQAQYLLKCDPF
jgi:hypothetical protein